MKRIVSLLLILTLVLTMAACGNGGTTEAAADGLKAGTYTGEGAGFNGPIKVEVTVGDDGKVSAVNVVEHTETAGIGDVALETLSGQVVEKNGTEGVEATSGATGSWNGFIEAVNAALDQAK